MIKLPKITEASIDLSTICQLHCVECSTSKGITHAGIVGKGQLSFEDFSNFIDTNPEIKSSCVAPSIEIFRYSTLYLTSASNASSETLLKLVPFPQYKVP